MTCAQCGREVSAPTATHDRPSLLEPVAAEARPARPPDALESFSVALRVYKERFLTFLGLGLLNVILSLMLLTPLTFIPVVRRITGAADVGAEIPVSDFLASLPYLLFGVFLDTAINLAFAGVAAVVAVRHMRGEATSLRESLRAFNTNGGTVLVTALALSAVYIGGALFFLVPLIIFLHWFLYAPAIAAVEGVTLGDAFKKSREFAREHRTFGYALLVLGLIFTVNLVASGLQSSLAGVDGAIGLIVANVVHAIGRPLVGVAAAIPFVAHYASSARARDEKHGFRTTRCPQCATIVPFTYNGVPVDVSCPTCGNGTTFG